MMHVRTKVNAAEIEAKLKAAEEEKVKSHQEKTASEAQVRMVQYSCGSYCSY